MRPSASTRTAGNTGMIPPPVISYTAQIEALALRVAALEAQVERLTAPKSADRVPCKKGGAE